LTLVSPSPVPAWTRRDFLAGGLGAAGLAVVAAACASKTTHKVINVPPGTTAAADQLNLGVITSTIIAGLNQRIAFVIQGQSGFITPTPGVTFALGPDQQHLTPYPITIHSDALGAPTYLSLEHAFPTAGVYIAQVGLNGKTASAGLQVETAASEKSPIPGRAIPSLATPTTTDLHQIDPALLCTHTPPCPLHTVSLDVALKAGKPIALLFATPKFCQTATCGPTLDVLLRQMPPYASKIQFMHLEIYPTPPDFSSGSTPTVTYVVDAFNLTSEPILFLVGTDGKVRERIDGLVGDAEVNAALGRLSSAS
jgi:hypothetical protein